MRGRGEPVAQPATATTEAWRRLVRGGRCSRCVGSPGEEQVMKARWTIAAALFAVVAASLVLADDAWAAVIKGTLNDDHLQGTTDVDNMYGFAGDDIIEGFIGDDKLIGHSGNDTLEGGNDDD